MKTQSREACHLELQTELLTQERGFHRSAAAICEHHVPKVSGPVSGLEAHVVLAFLLLPQRLAGDLGKSDRPPRSPCLRWKRLPATRQILQRPFNADRAVLEVHVLPAKAQELFLTG